MPDLALNLVVIRSADLERAALFYQALGLSLVKEQHSSGPGHYACVIGPTVFEIYPCTKEAPSSSATRIGFRVPCLEGALAALAKQGAEVLSPVRTSPWGRRAVVVDPDGHRVEITE